MTTWTAIVLTSSDVALTPNYCNELERLKECGESQFISRDTIFLTLDDPLAGIGSGGATLNALLLVAERLSASHGYTVVTMDSLKSAKILILLAGRQFSLEVCGKPFICYNSSLHRNSSSSDDVLRHRQYNFDSFQQQQASLRFHVHNLIETVSEKIVGNDGACPPGVWVCSTDMFLTIPQPLNIQWPSSSSTSSYCQDRCSEGGTTQPDMLVLAVMASPQYATSHGIYKIRPQPSSSVGGDGPREGAVDDILYRLDQATLESHAQTMDYPSGQVPLVAGIVYFSLAVVETLLSFHTKPPLDACTYYGLDAGQYPIGVGESIVTLFRPHVTRVRPSRRRIFYSWASQWSQGGFASNFTLG